MTETISVIIPTYNSAATLPKAIESVRSQNWPDLEMVVVDDGSSDDTKSILESLAGHDLKSLRQNNEGPGAARNRGIRSTNGRWVAFLDADDVWLPGKLDAQMSLLRSNQSLAFCSTDSIRRMVDRTERIQTPRSRTGRIFANLVLGPQFDLPTVLVRRDCFDRTGFFACELRTGEDWDMWLRLSALYPGCHVPKALVLCQVSSDPDKYPLEMYERCQMRILDRLFSNQEIARFWPQLSTHRGKIYSWHQAMLAKSYLTGGRWRDSMRLGAASIRSHALGLYFLSRRWNSARRWPDLAKLSSKVMAT